MKSLLIDCGINLMCFMIMKLCKLFNRLRTIKMGKCEGYLYIRDPETNAMMLYTNGEFGKEFKKFYDNLD